MNRIIKFRAWDKKEETMGEVSQISWMRGLVWFKALDIGRKIDEVEMMQFTGLTDKNGKEIYEGDMVKLDEGEAVNMGRLSIISGAGGKKYEVFWYQLDWALRILGEEDRYGLGTGLSLSAYGASEYGKHLKDGEQSDTIEVIGNIYENPELLLTK